MKQQLLLLLFLFAFFGSGLAQDPVHSGFGSLENPVSGPCLSPEQHRNLAAYLQTKLRLLKPNPARVARPSFRWPLQVVKPTSAFTPFVLTNFVDHSPTLGPNEVNRLTSFNLDYQCGNLTYNLKSGYRHAGTDIALQPFDWQTMRDEVVSVVAAAPGVIIDKVDGNDDQSCGSFATGGNWNAVYVRHDDGSVTWYGHLKRGSLTPKRPGDRVNEGEQLGYVGSSGRSSAPHLHFEVYDPANRLIDPFVGACNKTTTESWWREQPDYRSKGINQSSVHLTQPVQFQCPATANQPNETAFVQPGNRVFLYTYGWNLAVGDSIRFDLLTPTQQVVSIVNSRSTNGFQTFFWWQSVTLNANAPLGTWTFRVRFGGKQYDHPFMVTNDLANALAIRPSQTTLRCPSDSVQLTANVPSKALRWRRNGALLDSPMPGQVVVRDTGTYTVELAGTVSAPVRIVRVPAPVAKPIIAQSGLVLTSSLPTNNQWLRNDAPITGATSATFTVQESGRYRVQNRQECGVVLSDAVEVLILATDTPDDLLAVWPNPAAATCEVRWAAHLNAERLLLTSATGAQVRSQPIGGQTSALLSVRDLPAGGYVVWLQSATGTYARRLLVTR